MSAPAEFVRFATVGLVSNACLYLVYLGMTALGVGPKTAMTALYCVGVLQTFYFNKTWSFRHEGHWHRPLLLYWTTYIFGYALNLLSLFILVDLAGFNHQVVQGLMILLLAPALFLAQKLWVFPKAPQPVRGIVSAGER
jgi:putative flippase GtrA